MNFSNTSLAPARGLAAPPLMMAERGTELVANVWIKERS